MFGHLTPLGYPGLLDHGVSCHELHLRPHEVIDEYFCLDGDETGTLKDLSKLMMKESTLENVFQTPNHTTVVGNVGNSVTLPCAVNMELKYGVVSGIITLFCYTCSL